MACCLMFFHLLLLYMFWKDKHFSSCANITNKIELRDELNGCVGSEVFEGVRLEQVNAGWGKREREGLPEERVKQKEYCSAR